MKARDLFVLAVVALHSFSVDGAAALVDDAEKHDSPQLLRGVPMDNEALEQDELEAAATATTAPVTKIRFGDKLQSDADAFIADVKNWIAGVIGDVLANTNVVTESTFALETKGEFDLDKPCAPLTAYKTFGVIRGFLDDPKHAALSDAAADTIMWHPSDECVARKNSVEVEGGEHVEFIATCNNELLLNASSVTSGVTKTQYFRKVETTGAFVGVDYFDGEIRAVGATGRLIANLKLRQIPNKVDSLLASWRQIVRECAAQNSLKVKGVVGGGWKQKYSKYGGLVGAYDTSILGYAKAFEIRYQGLPLVPPELPSSSAPVKAVPITEAPATNAPQTELPATTIPVAEVPVTNAPKTEAPITPAQEPEVPPSEAPVPEAPGTQAPAGEEPASKTPETEAPLALTPPVTDTSVTEAPDVPATTPLDQETPVTDGPVTETPTEDSETGAPDANAHDTKAPESKEPATESPDTTIPASEAPDIAIPADAQPAANSDTETPATEVPVATDTPTDLSGTTAPEETPATESPTPESASDAPPVELPGIKDGPADTRPEAEGPTETVEEENSAGTPTPGPSSALESTTAPPAAEETSPSGTIADTLPTDQTPFAFSRIGMDLSTGELKALADGIASLYVQSGVQCAEAPEADHGCFMHTAMAKVLHGHFSEIVLDMNVRETSSEKRADATERDRSLVSLIGFGTFSLVVLVYAIKRTEARRHGYAAIPNGAVPIHAESI